MGHALMENRHGLAVDGLVTQATGFAEREATLAMLDRRPSRRRITLGADKAYDVRGFIGDLRRRCVTPHVAIDGHVRSTAKTARARSSAVDGRTTRHPGYAVSQRCRKRIEEVFGWAKSTAGLAKVKLRGRARVEAVFTLALAAYDLIRLPKLLGAAA
jgi:Transposase DDE domain